MLQYIYIIATKGKRITIHFFHVLTRRKDEIYAKTEKQTYKNYFNTINNSTYDNRDGQRRRFTGIYCRN